MRLRPSVLVLGLVAAVCATRASAAAPPHPALTHTEGLACEYVVQVDDPASEQVAVAARLAGLAGPVTLSLPEKYAYAGVEPRLVDGPTARRSDDGAALSLEREGAFRWRLDPGDARAVDLAWTVRLDHRRQPGVANRDEYEHPYLADDHGLFIPGAVLLVPDFEPLDARVRFALPEGWPEHAPWPTDGDDPDGGLVYAPDSAALVDDLVALGHWDVHTGRTDDLDYVLAFAPGQRPLQEMVVPNLGPILDAEVALFGGAPMEHYLFVFGRPDQVSGYGGSPKQNAMTLFVSPDLPPDFAAGGVTHLIAHEFHHTWMKARCQPHDELRFVMEGFTDYYAHVVPWRLGDTSDLGLRDTFAEQLSQADGALAAVEGSLAAAGGPRFFEGGSAYQACYTGGLALALWTDLALRRAGEPEGLDELMRAFYEDPRWRDGTRPTLDDWFALVEERLGPELTALQRAAVTGTDDPDWPALLAEVDVEAVRRVEPVPGGPRANFDGTTVLAIDPTGAGGLLGLQGGDRLLEVNGQAVSGEGDVRRAWGQPVDGRMRLALERGGERVTIDEEPPTRAVYDLPSDLARRLR